MTGKMISLRDYNLRCVNTPKSPGNLKSLEFKA